MRCVPPASGRAAPTHVLYLHGFRSSPKSFKAQRVQAWLARHHPEVRFWCPQLPPSPREAVALVDAGTSGWPRQQMALMGSSLGGFYATVLAERLPGVPAVVMNPAVNPALNLARHIGEQRSWHDLQDRFFFRPEFVDELRALAPAAITEPARYYALIAKGDEVLDWREMSARYTGAACCLLEGSDHALSDFDNHLPGVTAFLGLAGSH